MVSQDQMVKRETKEIRDQQAQWELLVCQEPKAQLVIRERREPRYVKFLFFL